MTPPRAGAPLHVLMTADAIGGVWTYALDLATGYAARGVQTTLAVFGRVDPGVVDQAAEETGVRVVVTGEPLDWTAEDAAEVRRAAATLADLVRDVRPDVVHLNSPTLAIGGLDVPTAGACHSCVETWWRAVHGGKAPADFAWRTALLRQGMAACDLLIAPTAAFAQATADAHDVAAPVVVRNGRRPPRTSLETEPATFAFTAGRLWDEGKNIVAFDQAAALAGVDAAAAGPLTGPQGQGVRLAHARACGPKPPKAVAEQLALRPAFVSPSLYEPFGLAVLEAAQAGCPLLLADIASFRELWDGAALFFDPRDPAALARLLCRVMSDAELADRLGRCARARADAYDVDSMVDGALAAYGCAAAAFALRGEKAA